MRAILFGVVMVVAGCGGTQSTTKPLERSSPAPEASPPPAAPPAAATALTTMQQFSDAMCACADRPCLDKVTLDMTRWGQDQAQQAAPAPPLSEAETQQLAVITETMTRCMVKIMTADAHPQGGAPSSP